MARNAVTTGPTRRALLLGTAAAGAAACSSPHRGQRPAIAGLDPDVALRSAAVLREQSLIAALDRALPTFRGTPTASVLTQVRAEHLAHLEHLQVPSTPTAGPAAPGPGASPTALPALPPASSPTALAARRRAVRTALAAKERSAAAAHAAAVGPASGPLAALLAQLAASEASHAVVL